MPKLIDEKLKNRTNFLAGKAEKYKNDYKYGNKIPEIPGAKDDVTLDERIKALNKLVAYLDENIPDKTMVKYGAWYELRADALNLIIACQAEQRKVSKLNY